MDCMLSLKFQVRITNVWSIIMYILQRALSEQEVYGVGTTIITQSIAIECQVFIMYILGWASVQWNLSVPINLKNRLLTTNNVQISLLKILLQRIWGCLSLESWNFYACALHTKQIWIQLLVLLLHTTCLE